MMRDFLRTLLAFLIIVSILTMISFGINLLGVFIAELGIPSTVVFFLMGMAAGGYAQRIGRLFADFIEAVWERLYKVV
jgi:phage-related protein